MLRAALVRNPDIVLEFVNPQPEHPLANLAAGTTRSGERLVQAIQSNSETEGYDAYTTVEAVPVPALGPRLRARVYQMTFQKYVDSVMASAPPR